MSQQFTVTINHQFSTLGHEVYRAGVEKTKGVIITDTETVATFIAAAHPWATIDAVGGLDKTLNDALETVLAGADVTVLPDSEFEAVELSGETVSVSVQTLLYGEANDTIEPSAIAPAIERLFKLEVTVEVN